MEPKSIEVTRGFAWEFLKRTAEHKGSPGERIVQLRIMKHIGKVEGFEEGEGGGYVISYPEDPPDLRNATDEEQRNALKEFNERSLEWMKEIVFVELKKKERAWIWKTFYATDFKGKILPAQEAHIEEAAGYLKKRAALEALREDVEEWEDKTEEEETEEEKE
jgi:hypothetical protein